MATKKAPVNKKRTTKYDVLSPDGFSIHMSDTYRSIKKAREAFESWVKQFKIQGYYSSPRYGRIPYDEIKDYVQLKPLN